MKYIYNIETRRGFKKISFYDQDNKLMNEIILSNEEIETYEGIRIDYQYSVIFIDFQDWKDHKYCFDVFLGEDIESLAETVEASFKDVKRILMIEKGLERIAENNLKLEII